MRARFGDRWLGFTPEEMYIWLRNAGFVLERKDIEPIKLGLKLGLTQARKPA
jgi:ArsR family transcriptional regulator